MHCPVETSYTHGAFIQITHDEICTFLDTKRHWILGCEILNLG